MGGASWSWSASGLTVTVYPLVYPLVYALAIDPSNTSIVYAGWSGVFKSWNGGGTWISGLSGALVYALAIDPKNTSIVYAGTDVGVFKSTNGGGTWSAINTGLTATTYVYPLVYALAIDPSNTSIVYAGTRTSGGRERWCI